jgi:hypothetical protein
LGGGIDLVREIAMKEFDEFGNEFVTPSGISRQRNLLGLDRIDVPAKPRGFRAVCTENLIRVDEVTESAKLAQ